MTETPQDTHPELDGISTARLRKRGAKLRQECVDLERRAREKQAQYLAIADEMIRVRQEEDVAPLAREWKMTFQNLRKQLGGHLWTAIGYTPDKRGQLVPTAEKEAALKAAGWEYDAETARWTPPGGGTPVYLLAAWGRLQKAGADA